MRLLLLTLLRIYRLCVSPLLPVACRFTPTCSAYAVDALAAHGVLKGGMLALKRLLRCHPFGKNGFDPVPCPCPKEGAHE